MVVLRGTVAIWQHNPATGTGEMSIRLESGHVIIIPWEPGGELDAPPQGITDNVIITVELTHEVDTWGRED